MVIIWLHLPFSFHEDKEVKKQKKREAFSPLKQASSGIISLNIKRRITWISIRQKNIKIHSGTWIGCRCHGSLGIVFRVFGTGMSHISDTFFSWESRLQAWLLHSPFIFCQALFIYFTLAWWTKQSLWHFPSLLFERRHHVLMPGEKPGFYRGSESPPW